jgi:hypothetical protein
MFQKCSLTSRDYDYFFHLFKEIIVDNTSKPIKDIFDEVYAQKFYSEVVCSNDMAWHFTIGIEAFNEFIVIMNYLNVTADKIRQPCASSYYYRVYECFKEITIMTPPSEILGLSAFWKVLLESIYSETLNKSIEILNNIYTKISNGKPEIKSTALNDFFKKSLDVLKDAKSTESAKSTTTIERLLRCMSELLTCKELLKMNYKSHRKDEKGAPVTVRVQSNLKYGPSIYDIPAFESTLMFTIRAEVAKRASLKPEYVIH